MPKISVNKYRNLSFSENDIGYPWKNPDVFSES